MLEVMNAARDQYLWRVSPEERKLLPGEEGRQELRSEGQTGKWDEAKPSSRPGHWAGPKICQTRYGKALLSNIRARKMKLSRLARRNPT